MPPTEFTPVSTLLGGALIGFSAVLLMATMGRIAGISGIAVRLFPPFLDRDVAGRWALWQRMGQGFGFQGQGLDLLGLVNLNDDGRISEKGAVTAAETVYVAMDADDDGRITKEEYMAARMGPGLGWSEVRQTAMQAQKEARYAEMDADQDAAVTR